MRRRSFTPRFASKTIRSLAHFHAAEDEGKALVCKGFFRARGPRRKYFRWGKSHLNESVRSTSVRQSVPKLDVSLSKTVLRAAHPSVHRRRSRRLNAAAIRGPRRKYFRWGKDVRPRKLDETLSRHGRSARRVALLAPRAMFSEYCSLLE